VSGLAHNGGSSGGYGLRATREKLRRIGLTGRRQEGDPKFNARRLRQTPLDLVAKEFLELVSVQEV
jgi:hypothetical protein